MFFVGGAISYRALFNWISPLMYLTTMLGSPLFQVLFFTYLGRYAGSEDDAFFIVGNAVQVAAMSGIYGMTMGIANERQFGTLCAARHAGQPARRVQRPGAPVHRQRPGRLGVRLRRRLAAARLRARRGEPAERSPSSSS